MKLDREKIIDAAFALLDEEGLDKFNLRALAKRLSSTAAALYWHFKNKDELIVAMTQRIYNDAYNVLSEHDNLTESLLDFGKTLRLALRVTQDTARLCASAKPIEERVKHRKIKLTDPLVKLGLSMEDALMYEASIISYVLGWSVFDQNQSMHTYLDSLMDFDGTFEKGLTAMVHGLVELSPN